MLTLNSKKTKYIALIMCVFTVLVFLGGFAEKDIFTFSGTQFFCAKFSLCFINSVSYSLSGTALPHFEAWLGEDTAVKSDFTEIFEHILPNCVILPPLSDICGQAEQNIGSDLLHTIFHLRI